MSITRSRDIATMGLARDTKAATIVVDEKTGEVYALVNIGENVQLDALVGNTYKLTPAGVVHA